MGRRKRSGGRKEEDNGDVRGGAGAGQMWTVEHRAARIQNGVFFVQKTERLPQRW